MILIPIMASRLMISLKKAGSKLTELRSLPAIDLDPTGPTGNGSVLAGAHGISGTSLAPNQEDIELDSTLRWPRDRGLLQLR